MSGVRALRTTVPDTKRASMSSRFHNQIRRVHPNLALATECLADSSMYVALKPITRGSLLYAVSCRRVERPLASREFARGIEALSACSQGAIAQDGALAPESEPIDPRL